MRFLPALAIGLALLSTSARAQVACPAEGAILALSQAVLDDREKLPRLKARGFGAEAAYLKIRYGRMPLEEAAALASGLREAGVREAIDLAGALDATRGGFDALPKDSLAQFSALVSTVRAVLQHGDTEKLLTAIAALPPEQRISASHRIMPAVLDWPDARKAELAAAAGRHGLVFLQAGLIATQQDPKAWTAFAAGLPPEKLAEQVQAWNWAPALVGNPALPRPPAQDAAAETMRKVLHAAWIAIAREPERDFVMTYINYTGDAVGGAKAAEAVRAEIDAGRIRPEGSLDAAWLKAYRTLSAAAADPANVDTVLTATPFYAGRYLRSGGDFSVRDVIDRLFAVEALTPFVKGEASATPDMPAELSAKFQAQWPLWLEVAGALKAAPLTPLAKDTAKAPILAELLFAADDHARLADVVLAVEPVDAKLALATDFAMRLDRACWSTMHHQAEALLLAGQPIFKFDPAK